MMDQSSNSSEFDIDDNKSLSNTTTTDPHNVMAFNDEEDKTKFFGKWTKLTKQQEEHLCEILPIDKELVSGSCIIFSLNNEVLLLNDLISFQNISISQSHICIFIKNRVLRSQTYWN